MIAPMFWNLCKSSWRKVLHLVVLVVLFLTSAAQDGRRANPMVRSRQEGCGKIFSGYTLKGGKNAGNFRRLGDAESSTKCVQLCCMNTTCATALFVGEMKACYKVECEDLEACKPVLKSSKYDMSIFQKGFQVNPQDITSPASAKLSDDPNRALIREKRHESCHHYHGRQCTGFLDKKRLLYFNRYPPFVERSLIKPLKTLKPKLSPNCRSYALHAICHSAFPYCTDRSKPSATFLCRTDCEQLYAGVCHVEFMGSDDMEADILPDCTKLPLPGSPGAVGCISLNIPEALRVVVQGVSSHVTSNISSHPLLPQTNSDKTNALNNAKSVAEDDLTAFKNQINKPVSSQRVYPTGIPGTRNIAGVMPKSSVKSFSGISTPNAPSRGLTHGSEGQSKHDDNSSDSISKSGVSNNEKGDSEDSDLETPKRSDISKEVKSSNRASEVGENHPQLGHDQLIKSPLVSSNHSSSVNTTSNAPSSGRTTGLGLMKSLGLLEPTSHVSQSGTGHKVQEELTVQPTGTPGVSNDEGDTAKKERHTLPSSSPTDVPSESSGKNISIENQATVVNVTGNVTETNLAQTDTPTGTPGPTAPTAQPTVSGTGHSLINGTSTAQPTNPSTGGTSAKMSTGHPTEAPPTLQVSAGESKTLTLPTNRIELYASAFPKSSRANPYTYHWQQIAAPQGSHGYMEGKDTRRVILSKLSHIGTYQFKVTVTGANHAFGFANVNVTVRPVPRVNKPPRADISPKEQTITLPTNAVVLDGSKSTDDDKIAQYKWEEVKGPLNDKNKMISSGADSPVLQLKSLVPGIYTFKLTVVDSDGDTDSTTATVTVNDEKDYPPVARAGNDAVMTLPVNHVTLYGNGSTDDKGIVSYEWSKAPSSPAVGDMQGTNSQRLKVSNMVVGDYTFVLKVTDTGGQSASSRVTVVVQPEKNTAPVAKAGSDKDLVFPDDTTTLDARGSYDDQKIVKYHWEQLSGPSASEMTGADERVVTIKKLTEGHFVFKLTVTDDKGLAGSDTVAIKVKKDINQTPEARAGPDVVVHLPNRAAELDGSRSSDDHGITEYLWTRDPKSPAAGDVINGSSHQPTLRLSNLVEGMYKFKLTVFDAKGLKSSDDALLTVKEDENSAHLVELFLDVDITKFTEENKGQLIRKLAVILDVQDEDIVVEHLKETGTGHSMMVMFYVKGVSEAKDGQIVSDMLKEKIENEEGFFEFRMLKVEPYICRNNCSFHGYCDRNTKLCVCESFWMQNIFKSSFGARESNCDWSILYVTVIIFGIIMGIGGIIWAVCFCMGRISRRRASTVLPVDAPTLFDSTSTDQPAGRRLRTRRRHRYAIIDDDDDKTESMEMLPKGKYSSLLLSDTDDDSEEETTLFEAKKRVMNGNANGVIGRNNAF